MLNPHGRSAAGGSDESFNGTHSSQDIVAIVDNNQDGLLDKSEAIQLLAAEAASKSGTNDVTVQERAFKALDKQRLVS